MSAVKDMHLPVRKQREYDKLQREKKDMDERIKALETLGTSDPEQLVERGAEMIAKAIKTVPESLKRKAIHLAITMAVVKSPRGRKPVKAH